MNKRDFLKAIGAASVAAVLPRPAFAVAGADYGNLLILVELKGGNDGLNTVIPYAADEYYALRPRLGVPRDQVLQLDERTGLHPSFQALMPLWQARELAIVQGLGYPNPNLSHFRSIEIWDTASNSNEYLPEGWLARAFAHAPAPQTYAAEGVVVAGAGLGPLTGPGARAITLANPAEFVRDARLAAPAAPVHTGALKHILRVESGIAQAAASLTGDYAFRTEFPRTGFGNAVRSASQVVATRAGVAVIKLSLNGFDTHSNQAPVQARLLTDLADGLAALKGALVETGRWDSTLIVTYAEFGRRPRENQSAGTDHGTASAHFVLGGRVAGGLYGEAPALARVTGGGNLPHALDFRQLYATILQRWWSTDSHGPLRGRYAPLPLVRA